MFLGGLGWPSQQWDDAGLQGWALIQQVTGVADPVLEVARICEALTFVKSDGSGGFIDALPEERPTSGFLYVWFGDLSGFTVDQFVPAADLVIPVTLPTTNMPDTGARSTQGWTIYRLCAQITPILDIPEGVIANVALVAETDNPITDPNAANVLSFDSVGVMIGDPTVPGALLINLVTGEVIARGFPAPACNGIMALEVFGPDPVPTVSEWGMVAMTLLVLTAGTIVTRYRVPVAA